MASQERIWIKELKPNIPIKTREIQIHRVFGMDGFLTGELMGPAIVGDGKHNVNIDTRVSLVQILAFVRDFAASRYDMAFNGNMHFREMHDLLTVRYLDLLIRMHRANELSEGSDDINTVIEALSNKRNQADKLCGELSEKLEKKLISKTKRKRDE
jgi:hypothetical protein